MGTGNHNVGHRPHLYRHRPVHRRRPEFGADATELFNYLTGYSQQMTYRKFLVAPVNLRGGLLERIEREIRSHKKEGKGHIIFKMNSLVDSDFIRALYRASQAGVRSTFWCAAHARCGRGSPA